MSTNDVVIGRNKGDIEKYGMAGTILLGKHYVKMGQVTSLSNKVYLDIVKAHVLFICGKRGGGKSYTMGVIAEGMIDMPMEVKQNLSIIMVDIMGVYWTMKFPNHKEEEMLADWGLKGKGLDIKIYTPFGYYKEYKESGFPTDFAFALIPSELSPADWAVTFGFNQNDPTGVLVERILHGLHDKYDVFGLDEIINGIKTDDRAEQVIKDTAENHFTSAQRWGLFDKNGTKISELVKGGEVTVLDVSCYATMPNGWAIKSLVVGLVAQKLFVERMIARKKEEFQQLEGVEHYFSSKDKSQDKQQMPLVWLVIDEAHEFLPVKGKTTATDALVTIMREGRQPGISLILATQQPGKIHTDVMTQSDIVLSHRITAKLDTDALAMLTQSYMREGLDKELNNLPRVSGAAILFDDTNERLYPIRVRPRFTWHGGESPVAVKKKKVLDF
jgi:uncharacterized protein